MNEQRPSNQWRVAPGDPTCVFTGDLAKPIKCMSQERAALVVAAVNAYRRDSRCDCENPDPASGAALVSTECPVHNEKPRPKPTDEPLDVTDVPDTSGLTLPQLEAGKRALFGCSEDPTFDDVRAVITAVRGAKPTQNSVDWLGLALDLEAQAKRVESQTVERSMLAAAHGLRLMGAAEPPAECPKCRRRSEYCNFCWPRPTDTEGERDE